jgi:4-hydroxybenzoate polyprenyltransferase and related prenyltransferases
MTMVMDTASRIAVGDVPLAVDLDGTLLHTDVLWENALALLARNPLILFLLPFWLLRGRAHLKRMLALRAPVDPAVLPYDARVLELLDASAGRPRWLVTAADQAQAEAIAAHLGRFEGVIASDGISNLAGPAKAAALVERFGDRGFDYLGNGLVDLRVWRHARRGWVVNAPGSLSRRAAALTEVVAHWPRSHSVAGAWLRAIRLHQWTKNLLVFVPLAAAHRFFDAQAILASMQAFLAFGLCASGVYIANDLLDLTNDRRHPRKRLRPFASGRIPLLHGMVAAPLLALAGLALAWRVSPAFAAVLVVYWLATLSYSLWLKRIQMLDVTVLAGLYTVRIVGGAVAIAVPLSFWLLAFSMFIFLSLALLKRYTELAAMASDGGDRAHGRGYMTADLPLLQSLGGSSGYIAVLVLALYINSPDSIELYSRPQLLWLLCPLLLYWVGRAWALAHRGRMHDDPVVFAVTDRVSLVVAALFGLVVFGAI